MHALQSADLCSSISAVMHARGNPMQRRLALASVSNLCKPTQVNLDGSCVNDECWRCVHACGVIDWQAHTRGLAGVLTVLSVC